MEISFALKTGLPTPFFLSINPEHNNKLCHSHILLQRVNMVRSPWQSSQGRGESNLGKVKVSTGTVSPRQKSTAEQLRDILRQFFIDFIFYRSP